MVNSLLHDVIKQPANFSFFLFNLRRRWSHNAIDLTRK
jgi:hypothetical protein